MHSGASLSPIEYGQNYPASYILLMVYEHINRLSLLLLGFPFKITQNSKRFWFLIIVTNHVGKFIFVV